jgi:hypothetical protein
MRNSALAETVVASWHGGEVLRVLCTPPGVGTLPALMGHALESDHHESVAWYLHDGLNLFFA